MNMLLNWKRKRKLRKSKIPIGPAFHIRNVMANLFFLKMIEGFKLNWTQEYLIMLLLDPLNYIGKGYISDEDIDMLFKILKEKRKEKTEKENQAQFPELVRFTNLHGSNYTKELMNKFLSIAIKKRKDKTNGNQTRRNKKD